MTVNIYKTVYKSQGVKNNDFSPDFRRKIPINLSLNQLLKQYKENNKNIFFGQKSFLEPGAFSDFFFTKIYGPVTFLLFSNFFLK